MFNTQCSFIISSTSEIESFKATDLSPGKGIQRKKATPPAEVTIDILSRLPMDAEEGRERRRVNLADDPSNRAIVQRDLYLPPTEILLEILSRLPITSLLHFKTTSHASYDLIADPRLPPMFCNRVSDSNPCLILFNYNSPIPRRLYFLDSQGCSRGVRKIDPPQHSKVDNLVGSCNGLLCLSLIDRSSVSRSLSRSLLIYNPFVGDAVRVPPANRFRMQREVFGFGFHPRTGEFKVVRIVSYDEIVAVANLNELVQVFTVGTAEWRNKGAPPPEFTVAVAYRPPEALVEGSLNWAILGAMDGVSRIISFDLADEVFVEIPHPPCQQFVSLDYSLSVLNGCLSATGLVNAVQFDIWVMKQYHVEESWVKQFSFNPYFTGGWRSFSTVICALKNGEILLRYGETSLVSYDPVENRFKTLQISGLPDYFQALPFLPSPFSAKATMNLQL